MNRFHDLLNHFILQSSYNKKWKRIHLGELILLGLIENEEIDISNKNHLHLGPGNHHAVGYYANKVNRTVPLHRVVYSQDYLEKFIPFEMYKLERYYKIVIKNTSKQWKVWSVTKSPEEVTEFIKKYPLLHKYYSCMYGSFSDIPLPDNSMDLVSYIDMFNIIHWKDMYPELFEDLSIFTPYLLSEFNEAIRVCKKGGQIFVPFSVREQWKPQLFNMIEQPADPDWVLSTWVDNAVGKIEEYKVSPSYGDMFWSTWIKK